MYHRCVRIVVPFRGNHRSRREGRHAGIDDLTRQAVGAVFSGPLAGVGAALVGRIAMRLLSFARHKLPSKADGRETLVDAAGAPPGFPLVPTP